MIDNCRYLGSKPCSDIQRVEICLETFRAERGWFLMKFMYKMLDVLPYPCFPVFQYSKSNYVESDSLQQENKEPVMSLTLLYTLLDEPNPHSLSTPRHLIQLLQTSNKSTSHTQHGYFNTSVHVNDISVHSLIGLSAGGISWFILISRESSHFSSLVTRPVELDCESYCQKR